MNKECLESYKNFFSAPPVAALITTLVTALVAASTLGLGASSARAEDLATPAMKYRVTIRNLTTGQVLSPPLLATHSPQFQLFTLGKPASAGISLIAEDGPTDLLANEVRASGQAQDIVSATAGIMPGASATYEIQARAPGQRLSFASMLVSTNDGFAGLQGAVLPSTKRVYLAGAYDAGTEENTESCKHVPGPPCSAHNSRSTKGAEGKVQMHKGIAGHGDLPKTLNWNGPVAEVTVEPVR